jgi:hypothetical protein
MYTDFEPRLRDGKKWELYVARKFASRGFETFWHPRANPNATNEEMTVLDRDILVSCWAGLLLTFECKSRNQYFTGPKDFPFNEIIVDTADGWDAKAIRPTAVIMVSKQTGGIAVVPSATQKFWREQPIVDRQRQIVEIDYLCPRDRMVSFDQLCRWLERVCPF